MSTAPSTPEPLAPILKWVGGKARLVDRIVAHYDGQRRIVEPFFGGGAVSFHLAGIDPTVEVVANDALDALIGIYEAVRTDPEQLIVEVERFADPYLAAGDKADRRAFYYEVRDRYMRCEIDGPAPLLFLLRCAYSGLYRTGKAFPGRFNTSHGFGVERPGFHQPDRIRAAAAVMGDWTLRSGDFADVAELVDASSFVFLDPPYRETYGGYTGDGFDESDQARVVEFALGAADRGARVVYTNKDLGDGFYDAAFAGWRIERVPIRYQVNRNCTTVGRPETFEVLISNT